MCSSPSQCFQGKISLNLSPLHLQNRKLCLDGGVGGEGQEDEQAPANLMGGTRNQPSAKVWLSVQFIPPSSTYSLRSQHHNGSGR